MIIYNLVIITTSILLLPILLIYLYFSEKIQYLPHFFGNYLNPGPEKDTFWFHCVSLGEFITILPLIQAVEKAFPAEQILVSTTAPDVLKSIQKRGKNFICTLFPLDLWLCHYRIFKKFRIRACFLSENDIWPAWILFCRKKNIPIFFINCRISWKIKKLFELFPVLSRLVFSSFTLCFPGSIPDHEILLDLGVRANRCLSFGNLKSDQLKVNPDNFISVDNFFKEKKPVFILGSSHDFEDLPFLEKISLLPALLERWNIIIAPRDIKRVAELTRFCQKKHLKYSLRSGSNTWEGLLILDTFGELQKIYSICNLAFVGGSIARDIGGHNPLEPLSWGVRTYYGKKHRNFETMIEPFVKNGLLFIIRDISDLIKCLKNIEIDELKPQKNQEILKNLLNQKISICAKIFNSCLHWIQR
ncbi:3-deoxy-D-manno-octulosonic acid transferase [Candidatus Riflebacteria bacterium]